MNDPREDYRRLVRMTHDKLWLESTMGNHEAQALVWPEVEPAPAASQLASAREALAGVSSRRQSGARPPARGPARAPAAPAPGGIPESQQTPASGDFQPEPGPFLDPGSGLSKLERLTQLWEIARQCTRCNLCRKRRSVVFGEGNPDAALMFIGEGPGYQEDATGRPFVGPAGQLLDKIIAAIELGREQVYIANIVKCRPERDRTPSPDEAQTCRPYLLAQIEIIRPRVLCLLGATACRYMTGTSGGITRMRGAWLEFRGIPMMPTFHPAYLLRHPEAKKQCWEDMQKVRDKARELAAGG